MKNTIGKQAEALKKQVNNASEKSKEGIKHLVDVNSKQFQTAIDNNSKTFDSISKSLYEKEMDPSIVSSFKANFLKSIKLSEDAIDSVIDSYTDRVNLSVDFTTKFADAIRNEDLSTQKGIETLLELVKENLDKSTELSVNNMEKFTSVYNNHLNLALNFNRKFADNVNSQVNAMFKLQKKNIENNAMLDMVAEWWKTVGEEKATV